MSPTEDFYGNCRKMANLKMEELYKKLIALPRPNEAPLLYELGIQGGWNNNEVEINIQVFPKQHEAYYKTITIYTALVGNSYSYNTNYKAYIRLKTDNYNIAYKRNWTFDTPNLTEKVQAKVTQFYLALIDTYTTEVVQKTREKDLTSYLKYKYPKATDIIVRYGVATVSFKTGESFEYDSDTQTYAITLRRLTEDQLDTALALDLRTRRLI